MLETVKKIVLSLSVVVLFALYAMQKQARPLVGVGSIAKPAASASRPAAASPPAVAAWNAAPRSLPTFATIAPTAPAADAVSTTAAAMGSSDAALATVAEAPLPTPTPTPMPVATEAAPSLASAGNASDPATAQGGYRDGTYDGGVADANWGEVEVQAVIAGGQLRDVRFLQYPNHRGRSVAINQQAMPILTQEAIESQQAAVDVVTGATDTSEAFVQSLGSALAQAAT
ncbi:MAG TPA: FMN-binding protein [Thermomicrobiales bacterium]|nr:FMN-binding protein [Thermomicrobiales bacterium]